MATVPRLKGTCKRLISLSTTSILGPRNTPQAQSIIFNVKLLHLFLPTAIHLAYLHHPASIITAYIRRLCNVGSGVENGDDGQKIYVCARRCLPHFRCSIIIARNYLMDQFCTSLPLKRYRFWSYLIDAKKKLYRNRTDIKHLQNMIHV